MASTTSAAANKALVRRFIEEGSNARDYDLIEEVTASDIVIHNAPGTDEEVIGRDAYMGLIREYFEAIPDLSVTLEDIIAEDELVAYRATYTGTHEGEIMGVPATGKKVSVEGNVFVRIEDGKVAELRGQLDTLGFLQQLGAIEAPGA